MQTIAGRAGPPRRRRSTAISAARRSCSPRSSRRARAVSSTVSTTNFAGSGSVADILKDPARRQGDRDAVRPAGDQPLPHGHRREPAQPGTRPHLPGRGSLPRPAAPDRIPRRGHPCAANSVCADPNLAAILFLGLVMASLHLERLALVPPPTMTCEEARVPMSARRSRSFSRATRLQPRRRPPGGPADRKAAVPPPRSAGGCRERRRSPRRHPG